MSHVFLDSLSSSYASTTTLLNILSRVWVTYKTGFGLDDGFIAPYTCTFTQLRNTGNYSAITILHALQFTVAHALGFSVFNSRILATGL
jgi:hypothetical protein